MIKADSKIYDIAVIGGGAAGIMAALRGVLNFDEVLLLPGSIKHKKKSRATWVYKVENMPGYTIYKKGIDEPNKETLKFLEQEPYNSKLTHLKGVGVEHIKKDKDIFYLTDSEGNAYKANYVILATGVMDVQPKIQKSIEPVFPYANAQVIDYCLRCDGHHVYGKRTTVIGHSNVAAWVAVMLYERYKTPEMMVMTNGEKPQFSDEVKQLLKLYKIKVNTLKILEVVGDEKQGILKGYVVEYNGKPETVETDFTFVSLGMLVYNELALEIGAKVDDRGFVICNEKGETSIENLYVAGDLRAGIKKQIYTAWDSAVDSADDINGKIRRNRRNKLLEESKKIFI